jgi:glycosyltransferase involved in cell wall biosynthesis
MKQLIVPISVVINTKNEEKNLSRVLSSVHGWVNEIIVCDMNSNDRTIEIAERYGCIIKQYDDIGYVEPARKFAVEGATNEWVLLLDADEAVDRRLRNWIIDTFKHPDKIEFDGVELPWIQYMSGREIKYSNFGNQTHLRLFRKEKFRFSDKIHSRRQAVGDVKTIKLDKTQVGLLHFNCASLKHFLAKFNSYAYIEAGDIIKERKHYDFTLSKGIFAFVSTALKTYFSHKGYKDGLIGLHISLCMGIYAFLVRSYAHEISQNGDESNIYAIYDNIAKKEIE